MILCLEGESLNVDEKVDKDALLATALSLSNLRSLKPVSSALVGLKFKSSDSCEISSKNNSAYSIPNVQNNSLTTFSPSSPTDATAMPNSTKQGSSPLKKQVNIDQPIENKGKLNVLQLSTPQQNELKEKERKLAEMEKSLREREALVEENIKRSSK